MIRLILLFGIIGFAVAILLNIFYTYIPIANIEKKVDEATDKVDMVVQQAEEIKKTIEEEAKKELERIEEGVCSICKSLPMELNFDCFVLANSLGINCAPS